MKTQIIQLEPHDDHISIRDKMNWSKTPRILLVFPRRRRFDLDTLDLKLLQRHARSLGAELGLVTKSLKVIRSAEALGIPTFPDNLAAQRGTWTKPKTTRPQKRRPRQNLRAEREEVHPKEANWHSHIATRIAAGILAALALLALVVAFVPKATIVIAPERRTQTITIPVRASAETTEVFLSGSIPAQTLRVTLTDERSLPASGQKAVPSQGARGLVLFRNLTDQPVRIPQGTIIRSIADESIRFETEFEALVNAGVGEDIEVPVIALTFGEDGNLDVDMLQAIEGDLRFWLTTTNPAPTTGGSDSFVHLPTKSDRAKLHNLMMANFAMQAEKSVDAALRENDILFPATLSEIEFINESYDPPEGETGDRLTLSMQVEIQAQYATETDLTTLAEAALAASIRQGFAPVPGTLRYEVVDDFKTNTLGVTSWQMRVEQELIPTLSAAQIASWAQGHSLENAARTLTENLELEGKPKISIFPSWWKWMPLAPFHIEMIVE